MRRAVAGVMLLVFAGCGGATQRTSLRVVDLRDGMVRPLQGALVRVIPMDAGMVPLPVSLATLNESAYARAGTVAYADGDGIVHVDVLGDRAAWIEVERPAVGPAAERTEEAGQAWRWRWEPGQGALIGCEEGSAWSVGLEPVH